MNLPRTESAAVHAVIWFGAVRLEIALQEGTAHIGPLPASSSTVVALVLKPGSADRSSVGLQSIQTGHRDKDTAFSPVIAASVIQSRLHACRCLMIMRRLPAAGEVICMTLGRRSCLSAGCRGTPAHRVGVAFAVESSFTDVCAIGDASPSSIPRWRIRSSGA